MDCIIISLSVETKSARHLQEAIEHNMNLIQFDRLDSSRRNHRRQTVSQSTK
ncbi:MAG TPA: hypothetical protein VD772_06000 [Anseongella sp.]|nr:hypothetical protein [Anseongella sp.]